MKFWKRATLATHCGNCGDHIPEGEPLLQYRISDTRSLTRCQACAGEPVNLAQLDLPKAEPRSALPFSRLGEIAPRFDPKVAQCGKDE